MTKNEQLKRDIIEKVNEYIDKKQYLPWDKGILNGDFEPFNPLTKTKYQGINHFLLMFMGGDTQEYATFNQIKKAGGKLNKGSKGFPIIYYNVKKWNKEEQRPAEPQDNPKDIKDIPFLQKYTVFSLADVEGIEKTRQLIEQPYNPRFEQADEVIEYFVKATGLEVKYRSGTGLYSPANHKIEITPIQQYKTSEKYYKTFFHELMHSTGKAMGRNMDGHFGSKSYSKEEIVAEFGAMMLCNIYGIEPPIENTAEYLRGWSKALRDNPNWLFDGAKESQKAVEYFIKTVEEYRTKQNVA